MSKLKIIGRYLHGYERDAVLCALAILSETILELYIPLIMTQIVDDAIPASDLQLTFALGGRMVVCAVGALLLGFCYARLAARVGLGLGANLREAEYERVQEYSFANLDNYEASSLVTRLTTDVTVIQDAVATGFRPILRGPAFFIIGLAMAAQMSLRLSLVFLVVTPFLAVALYLIIRHVAPLYRRLQGVMDHLNSVLQENFAAIRVIKAFVREDYVADRFADVNGELAETSTNTFKVAVLNTPAFQLTMYTASVLILWLGGNMIMEGTLTVGELTGFMSYVLIIVNSLMFVSNVFLRLARAITSVERVTEVLEEEPQIVSPKGGIEEVPTGEVEFRGVSFKYSVEAEEDVLEHVNLHFAPGFTVGVLGGTGSGKTSLVQLVARLYDASEGSVLVGGHDVRDYDLVPLRDSVGVVLQKNVLFSGTVRENLRWGNPDATDEELLEACRIACADEFLDRIGGLDGDLGQGGVNVSGGQKQRLCIARTLLKNPRVLIFDDSTSAVDMATDATIRQNLAGLTDVTKVVIAQRVASVMEADQIVVLDDGRVHATGTHEELLASDPIYQELYESQIGSGIHGEVTDGSN